MLCLHSWDLGKGQEMFLLAKRPRGCREPRHLRPVSGMGGLRGCCNRRCCRGAAGAVDPAPGRLWGSLRAGLGAAPAACWVVCSRKGFKPTRGLRAELGQESGKPKSQEKSLCSLSPAPSPSSGWARLHLQPGCCLLLSCLTSHVDPQGLSTS